LAWIPLFHSLALIQKQVLRYQSEKQAQNMTTQSLDSPRQSLLAPVTANADLAAKKMTEELSERGTGPGVCCDRPGQEVLAGRTDYESVERARHA